MILAAGKGTRMNSPLPKPLIPLADRPIIRYVIDALRACHVSNIALVVGHQADLIKSQLGDRYQYVVQPEQKGMAHAVSQAVPIVSQFPKTLVFVGDSPLIQPDSIRKLIQHHQKKEAACSFLTAVFPVHFPYARVIRDDEGNVLRCVEERYATEEEKNIREYLTSHYIFDSEPLLAHVQEIKTDPATDEAYLTDIIGIFSDHGHRVNAVPVDHYRQLVGLNTPEDVLWAEAILKGNGGES